MKKIINLILILPILFLLSSCGFDFDKTTFGDFVYTQWTTSGDGCDIKSLSDEGQKKDTIVFTSTLNNLNVYSIDSTSNKFYVDNATNIYFNNSLYSKVKVYYGASNVNLYLPGKAQSVGKQLMYMDLLNVENHTVFIHKDIFDTKILNYKINFVPANVVYYLKDYEDLYDVFFLDDCDNTTVNVVPPSPIKEGFEFIGWYKDLEFTEEWDFDNDIISAKQYDFNNNYIFNETKIYAKFEVIS